MRLNARQRCPIPGHGFRCECRTIKRKPFHSKWEHVRPGVRRIKDEHADHPDGYRYKLSKSEMEKVLLKMVEAQKGCCFYCGKQFQCLNEVTPDHLNPKGAGGARRDDRADNLVAACWPCNSEKGSKRVND